MAFPIRFARKPWVAAAIAIVLLFALFSQFNPNYRWTNDNRQTPYGADFLQEWVGGAMIANGASDQLYSIDAFREWQHDPSRTGFRFAEAEYFPPVYPPPYYWLCSPLANVPYRYAVWIWASLLTIAFCASVWLLERLSVASATPRKKTLHAIDPSSQNEDCSRTFIDARHDSVSEINICNESVTKDWSGQAYWLAMILFPPVLVGLTMGQKGTVWLLIWAAAWYGIQRNRLFVAGLVFGILSLKPTLFFLVPLLMLRYGQWRFLSGLAVSTAMIWVTAILALPDLDWNAYLQTIAGASSYQQHGGYREHWSCNVLTLINQLAPASVKPWLFLTIGSMIVLLIASIPKRDLKQPSTLYAWMLGTVLMSPHFYFYDLVILLAAFRLQWPSDRSQMIFGVVCIWSGILLSESIYAWSGLSILPVIMGAMLGVAILRDHTFISRYALAYGYRALTVSANRTLTRCG